MMQQKFLRPSPNEEAQLLKNLTKEKHRKRLKEVRRQDRLSSHFLRDKVRKKKECELQKIALLLEMEFEEHKGQKEIDLLEELDRRLMKLGEGHRGAEQEKENYGSMKVLSDDLKHTISLRYKKAINKVLAERYEETRQKEQINVYRSKVFEMEKERKALVLSLPRRPLDPILNLQPVKAISSFNKQGMMESYSHTRYHLSSQEMLVGIDVMIEKALKEEQVDARKAAEEEEIKTQTEQSRIAREVEERKEKAELRHVFARNQVVLKQENDALLEELENLELKDRQRRKNVVAKIPKKVFQPPYQRVEDEKMKQFNLEKAFEHAYNRTSGDILDGYYQNVDDSAESTVAAPADDRQNEEKEFESTTVEVDANDLDDFPQQTQSPAEVGNKTSDGVKINKLELLRNRIKEQQRQSYHSSSSTTNSNQSSKFASLQSMNIESALASTKSTNITEQSQNKIKQTSEEMNNLNIYSGKRSSEVSIPTMKDLLSPGSSSSRSSIDHRDPEKIRQTSEEMNNLNIYSGKRSPEVSIPTMKGLLSSGSSSSRSSIDHRDPEKIRQTSEEMNNLNIYSGKRSPEVSIPTMKDLLSSGSSSSRSSIDHRDPEKTRQTNFIRVTHSDLSGEASDDTLLPSVRSVLEELRKLKMSINDVPKLKDDDLNEFTRGGTCDLPSPFFQQLTGQQNQLTNVHGHQNDLHTISFPSKVSEYPQVSPIREVDEFAADRLARMRFLEEQSLSSGSNLQNSSHKTVSFDYEIDGLSIVKLSESDGSNNKMSLDGPLTQQNTPASADQHTSQDSVKSFFPAQMIHGSLFDDELSNTSDVINIQSLIQLNPTDSNSTNSKHEILTLSSASFTPLANKKVTFQCEDNSVAVSGSYMWRSEGEQEMNKGRLEGSSQRWVHQNKKSLQPVQDTMHRSYKRTSSSLNQSVEDDHIKEKTTDSSQSNDSPLFHPRSAGVTLNGPSVNDITVSQRAVVNISSTESHSSKGSVPSKAYNKRTVVKTPLPVAHNDDLSFSERITRNEMLIDENRTHELNSSSEVERENSKFVEYSNNEFRQTSSKQLSSLENSVSESVSTNHEHACSHDMTISSSSANSSSSASGNYKQRLEYLKQLPFKHLEEEKRLMASFEASKESLLSSSSILSVDENVISDESDVTTNKSIVIVNSPVRQSVVTQEAQSRDRYRSLHTLNNSIVDHGWEHLDTKPLDDESLLENQQPAQYQLVGTTIMTTLSSANSDLTQMTLTSDSFYKLLEASQDASKVSSESTSSGPMISETRKDMSKLVSNVNSSSDISENGSSSHELSQKFLMSYFQDITVPDFIGMKGVESTNERLSMFDFTQDSYLRLPSVSGDKPNKILPVTQQNHVPASTSSSVQRGDFTQDSYLRLPSVSGDKPNKILPVTQQNHVPASASSSVQRGDLDNSAFVSRRNGRDLKGHSSGIGVIELQEPRQTLANEKHAGISNKDDEGRGNVEGRRKISSQQDIYYDFENKSADTLNISIPHDESHSNVDAAVFISNHESSVTVVPSVEKPFGMIENNHAEAFNIDTTNRKANDDSQPFSSKHLSNETIKSSNTNSSQSMNTLKTPQSLLSSDRTLTELLNIKSASSNDDSSMIDQSMLDFINELISNSSSSFTTDSSDFFTPKKRTTKARTESELVNQISIDDNEIAEHGNDESKVYEFHMEKTTELSELSDLDISDSHVNWSTLVPYEKPQKSNKQSKQSFLKKQKLMEASQARVQSILTRKKERREKKQGTLAALTMITDEDVASKTPKASSETFKDSTDTHSTNTSNVSLRAKRIQMLDKDKLKEKQSENKERTKRLYERLPEVRQQATVKARQEALKTNREKAERFHQKLQAARKKRLTFQPAS